MCPTAIQTYGKIALHIPGCVTGHSIMWWGICAEHMYEHAHNLTHTTAQLITQPPESATVALNTNATFSCSRNGEVLWEISNIQIIAPVQVQQFADVKVFVPLPKPSFSELIVTATVNNEALKCETLGAVCQCNSSRHCTIWSLVQATAINE